MHTWMYDEFRHAGVNYADRSNAETYDSQHTTFRDYKKEFEEILTFIGLNDASTQSVIDLGCGTGAVSIYAAEAFKTVYSVDVSDVMRQQLQRKIDAENITNITVARGGFLSYSHQGDPADVLITKYAFHHLPDFWKQIALFNMNSMLKTGGTLYLCDVVFNFDLNEYQSRIDTWIAWFEEKSGREFAAEAATHIREEYSTFTWVLDEMLKRAGFEIVASHCADGFITQYHCVKIAESAVAR